MRILFVRHAQSTANVENHLDTAAPGAPLSELGRQQALALPAALASAVPETIEAVYASTLTRTQETAAPLATRLGLEVQVRRGLQEVLAGELEGLGDPDSIATYLANAQQWKAGDLDARLPGGETGHEVLRRMDAVVDEAVASGAGVVVLVSHGCAIWTWVISRTTTMRDVDPPSKMSNTALVGVRRDRAGGWHVTHWDGMVTPDGALADTDHDGPVLVPPTDDGAAQEA